MQSSTTNWGQPSRCTSGVRVFLCVVLFSMVALLVLYTSIGRSQLQGPLDARGVTTCPDTTCPDRCSGLARPGKALYISATVRGRLGNQMFQYASLLGIAYTNRRMDHAFYPSSSLLGQVFNVTHLDNRSTEGFRLLQEKGTACYDAKFQRLPEENVLLAYHLQSWMYFHHIQDVVRREFTFLPAVKHRAQQLLQNLTQARSSSNVTTHVIGVHIRRGEYAQLKVGGFRSPPPSFFVKAMQYYRGKLRHVLFLVVSEDRAWCRKHLPMDDVVFVPADTAPVHLALLTLCDHVVDSLGSFGWWAGYLAGGEVVYYNNCVYPNMTAKPGFVASEHFHPGWVGIGD